MIRRKRDSLDFIKDFETYADWDGDKYYISLKTTNPNGTLTLMKYKDDSFTYHRKNDLYWDVTEITADNEMLTDIIWGFRKAINECIRAKAKVC